MMRNFFTCFLILIGSVAFGQKDALKAGDAYYKEFQYYLAAEQYQKSIKENNTDIATHYKLAECYRMYFDYKAAQKEYQFVADKNTKEFPLAIFWSAEMYKLHGNYDEAEEQFNLFLESAYAQSKDDEFVSKAKIEVEGCEMARIELKKPIRDYNFELLPLPINSPTTDFAPAIFLHDSSIFFTSTRSETHVTEEEAVFGNQFSDQFSAEEKSQWELLPIDALNSKYNESVGSFTADRKTYYFTRCDQKSSGKDYHNYACAIYESKYQNESWGEPEMLNRTINGKGQWNAQPAISPKGDTLFFVSKREGGKGMHDIWYSIKQGEEWGQAINLEAVNTPYIDMSPCFDAKDNILFFASNGRAGFGGLDVFKAHGENYEIVENVGLPFNSNKDDFYFVLGEKYGYLSSNRDGGIGGDDIYRFTKESNQDALIAKTHTEVDDTGSVSITGKLVATDSLTNLEDMVEVLTDSEGNAIKTTHANEKGEFRFDNLPAGDYNVYIEEEDHPDLVSGSHVVVEDVHFEKSKLEATKVLFENVYFDFNRSKLRPEARKTLDELIDYQKKNPKIQIEINANTDNIGSQEYNKILSEKRGSAAYEYLVMHGVDRSAIVINAIGSDNPIASNENKVGRQLNRRVEFHIVGGNTYESKTMTYIIEPKQTIKLIAERFGMSEEELKAINGLQDERILAYRPLRVRKTGDADLIDPISMERGSGKKKSKKYYKKQAKRLNAYESSYDNLAHLSEEDEVAGFSIYTVRKKNTLFSIARLFKMTVDELKESNQIRSSLIHPGYRLKVKMASASLVGGGEYLVQSSDNLQKVAVKFGLTEDQLILINAIEGYTIQKGMVLKVK